MSPLGGNAAGILCNPLLEPDLACAGVSASTLPAVLQWSSSGAVASHQAIVGTPPADGLLRVTVEGLRRVPAGGPATAASAPAPVRSAT